MGILYDKNKHFANDLCNAKPKEHSGAFRRKELRHAGIYPARKVDVTFGVRVLAFLAALTACSRSACESVDLTSTVAITDSIRKPLMPPPKSSFG